ncbi:MAG: hypothetical protein LAKADJCE_00070 [Candidatus Argoarchaeum ethanivorans]|uniref:4Fe-4S ferredoxin-type domain-containing protein n=1 Tax=Candidatus Argoarchaeum ethanivorans TaxID=2608793 RepID=A0A811T6C1_9EURY|nr:MAG: hypothetical protein LAKADJCE_00070 [Candidatus Argoarchaeum ethanivorans]
MGAGVGGSEGRGEEMNKMQEDMLERCSNDYLEEIKNEKEDIHTTIRKYLGDYVSTVVEPLFKKSGQLDAKYARALSYPSHIIDAVFTGAVLYIYDRVSTGQAHPKTHDIKLLCTALTLHDVNKYWNEITGPNYSGNYRKLIQDYFEIDPFDLKTYFSDWASELEEIVFLVQHTQESDDAQYESRFSQPRYAKLLPYVKIGDKVASLSKLENPLQEIHKRLKNETHDVHLMRLPEIPQQLLSQTVYRSAKKFLVKSGGVPLLISPQGILYLSSDEIEIDPAVLKKLIGAELAEKTCAKPVLEWKKFDLAPLLSIPLDKQDRFDIYLESVREKTESGLLSVLGKTTYPQDVELQESLACITYFIYNDKGSDWTKFPELEKAIQEDYLKEQLRKMGEMRQNFADRDDVGRQKCKAYTVYELVQKHNDHAEPLRLLRSSVKGAILSKLDEESSALDPIVRLVCAYNREITGGLANTSPKGGGDVCFMCGAVADKQYKLGQKKHFLQVGGFTKRATPKDPYKRWCAACQIEHQLIDSLVQSSGFSVNEDLIFFYFYFDSVFVNVDPFQEQMSKVGINVQGTEKLGLNFTLGDFDTPFHIEPMAIRLPPKQTEHSSKSTRRARAIHTAIKACLKCGCKCVATSPYALIRMYDGMFCNERPSTLEKNLGIDHIKTFKDARHIVAQLDFINQFDGVKGLYRVQRFKPITVIPYVKSVKRKEGAGKFVIWANENGDRLHKLLGDETMDMKEIAEKGIALFRAHRLSSSYKRVKIFRTALDSLMVSKAQKYKDDEAVRFAAARVTKDVLREQHDKNVGKDIPAECLDYVESIAEYLKEHGLWNVKKISQWGNPLTDVYEFEYICATKTKGDAQ